MLGRKIKQGQGKKVRWNGSGKSISFREVREDLSYGWQWKRALKSGDECVMPVDMWGKSSLGRGISTCKGPAAGPGLVCTRHRGEPTQGWSTVTWEEKDGRGKNKGGMELPG